MEYNHTPCAIGSPLRQLQSRTSYPNPTASSLLPPPAADNVPRGEAPTPICSQCTRSHLHQIFLNPCLSQRRLDSSPGSLVHCSQPLLQDSGDILRKVAWTSYESVPRFVEIAERPCFSC